MQWDVAQGKEWEGTALVRDACRSSSGCALEGWAAAVEQKLRRWGPATSWG